LSGLSLAIENFFWKNIIRRLFSFLLPAFLFLAILFIAFLTESDRGRRETFHDVLGFCERFTFPFVLLDA